MKTFRLFAVVVPLIVGGFFTAHAIVARAAADMRRRAVHVQELAAISARLTSTRADLLDIASLFWGRPWDDQRPLDVAALDTRRARLKRDLRALEQVPVLETRPVTALTRYADLMFARAASRYRARDRSWRAIPTGTVVRRADEAMISATGRVAGEIQREGLEIAVLDVRLRQMSKLYNSLAGLFAVTLLGFAVHLTQRHQRLTEERKREVERRAEELEAFAGRVAHDLKNPLSALALQIDLGRRADGDGRQTGQLARYVRRMNDITDGLLAFARAGGLADPTARAEVSTVVDEVMQDFQPEAQASNIDLAVGAVDRVMVRCPHGTLASMLGNLVRNAVKYLGEQRERRVWIEARQTAAGRVRFVVEDTGPGVPDDRRESIFEPFVRVGDQRVPGVGLGLATVKRFAAAYEGRVGVSARDGGGSRFWIELPRAEA